MLEKLLEKLGLSEKEAKVYLAALELGQESVQNIAKKAGVNRPTAYFVLERLMELGLISTLEHGKKTLFVAESPKELESLLENEKREIENRRTELKESMNQFLAMYNTGEGKPTVRYFEGADGLEAMDRYGLEMVKKNQEILYVIPIDLIEKMFSNRRKASVNERVQKGIHSRAIYTYDREFTKEENKIALRDGVYMKREELPIDGTISIYPWGLKLYSFNEARPHGVVIESVSLANNMKLVFDLAWKAVSKK